MDTIRWYLEAKYEKIREAHSVADAVESKSREYETIISMKEERIASLNERLRSLEGEVDRAEMLLKDEQRSQMANAEQRSLERKVLLLERELDAAEKRCKEATDKLRVAEAKAEHFETRLNITAEQRDQAEKKYDDAQENLKRSGTELDRLINSFD